MFYINRRVGRRWGVVDTDDGVEELYYTTDLKRFHDSGISIQGCGYVSKRFVVSCSKPVNDIKSAVKNKLSVGSATCIDGFDLEFTSDGRVVAKRLGQKFLDYFIRNSKKGRIILSIPEIVTDIDDNFMSDIFKNHYNLFVSLLLPSSLKVIGSNSLSSYFISSIDLSKCKLDLVKKGENSNCSLSIRRDTILSVKVLEKYSLDLCSINHLHLPDIERLDSCSLRSNFTGFCLHIGNKLKRFISPYDSRSIFISKFNRNRFPVSTQMMQKSLKVFIDDNSELEEISLNLSCQDEDYYFELEEIHDIELYIFIMSKYYYENKFCSIFSNKSNKSAVGVLLYDSQDEKRFIEENINMWCNAPRKYFKKYFSLDSLNKTEIFILK